MYHGQLKYICTHSRINKSGPNGLAPIIKVKVDSLGRFLSGKIIPGYQSYATSGVKIDPDKKAIFKIRNLTETDFPESVIKISDNGDITYK
jgi:hypothetical protein